MSTAIRIVIAALLLFGVVALAGGYAYNAGVEQGLAYGARVAAPEGGPYTYPHMAGRPFGWGFGPLACLFPLFGLFLVFGLMRMLFGRGHWGGHGMHGASREHWRARAQEHFDALHREAHGSGGDTPGA